MRQKPLILMIEQVHFPRKLGNSNRSYHLKYTFGSQRRNSKIFVSAFKHCPIEHPVNEDNIALARFLITDWRPKKCRDGYSTL